MLKLFSGKVLILLIGLTAADICLTPVLGILRPVLGYLLVLYAVLFEEGRQSAAFALTVGGLRDLTGIEPLGVETTVLLVMTLLLAFVILKIERESPWIRMAVVFIFVLTVFICRLVVGAFLTGSNAIPADYLAVSFFSAFSTAMISPFVFLFFHRFFGRQTLLKQYELFR